MRILLPSVFIIAAVIVVGYAALKKQYEEAEYYQQTQNPYGSIRFNKDRLGEFYTY